MLELSLAKIPSGRNEGLISNFDADQEVVLAGWEGPSVATNCHEVRAERVTKDRRTHLSRSISLTPIRNVRDSNSGGQIVAMMQAAEPWHRYDFASYFGVARCFTAGRRSLCQCKMRPVFVIVLDVLAHQAFQVAFIENDRMVEQIAAAIADPALGDTILPRTAEAGSLGLNAEALYGVHHLRIETGAAIKDQVAGRRIIRECLAQLLNDPGAGRVLGHIAVKDTLPVMRNDEEAIEHAEGQRRHGEEIHCSDGFTMVAEKGRPSHSPLKTPRRFSHPAQHRSLRNIEAQHLQFPVNSRRAPGRVLGNHAEDEFAQFSADAFSSHAVSMPREPSPIQLESGPMPANNGLWLDKNQRLFPSRPEPLQDYPKQFVWSSKPRLRVPLFQNGELLPKSQIL